MKKHFILFVAASLCVTACKKSTVTQEEKKFTIGENSKLMYDAPYQSANGANMLFKTEFDNSTIGIVNPQKDDISGSNITSYPWTSSNYNFGNAFQIEYQWGTDTQRKAVIANEGGNNVLNFSINDVANPSGNPPFSRIQANIYGFTNPNDGNKPFKEFYQSVRMKLDFDSFDKIRLDHDLLIQPYGSSTVDSRDWLTLFEFWNNNTWDAKESGTKPNGTIKYPFRISVNLNKKAPYEIVSNRHRLYFNINAQKTYSATSTNFEQNATGQNIYIWQEKPDFVVPLGTWMTIEIYMKEGDAGTGKFWMTVQPDGQAKTVLCNKTGYTYSQYDPSPNGIAEFNPMKLYVSGKIVDAVKPTTPLKVSWDSFKLYDKIPY